MPFIKYPSIERLPLRRDILKVQRVVACEKLHGTNFQVRFPRGIRRIEDVEFGTRTNDLGVATTQAAQDFYSGLPVRWFTDRPELLEALIKTFHRRNLEEVIVYVEACGTSIQMGVYYAPRHEVFCRSFHILAGDQFVAYDPFVEICEEAGLPRVPEIWRGAPSVEAFDALLERTSDEAARNGAEKRDIAEGVVISADPLVKDRRGNWLIFKHKTKKFEEVVRENMKLEHLRLEPTRHFAAMVVPPGRIYNVRGHLRDSNTPLIGDMPDLQYIAPAVVEDVRKECGDLWDELVQRGFGDDEIAKALRHQASATYRQILQEENPQAGEPAAS